MQLVNSKTKTVSLDAKTVHVVDIKIKTDRAVVNTVQVDNIKVAREVLVATPYRPDTTQMVMVNVGNGKDVKQQPALTVGDLLVHVDTTMETTVIVIYFTIENLAQLSTRMIAGVLLVVALVMEAEHITGFMQIVKNYKSIKITYFYLNENFTSFTSHSSLCKYNPYKYQ